MGRLFPDYPATEEAYFRKTQIFPIMHAIGIRRSLVERHPWLAVSVYKAFLKAKDLCMHELGQIGHLATSLPWSVAEYDRLRRVMGEDFWSYGVEPQPARAGDAGTLFPRPGPVGQATAGGRDVRAVDVRPFEDLIDRREVP